MCSCLFFNDQFKIFMLWVNFFDGYNVLSHFVMLYFLKYSFVLCTPWTFFFRFSFPLSWCWWGLHGLIILGIVLMASYRRWPWQRCRCVVGRWYLLGTGLFSRYQGSPWKLCHLSGPWAPQLLFLSRSIPLPPEISHLNGCSGPFSAPCVSSL